MASVILALEGEVSESFTRVGALHPEYDRAAIYLGIADALRRRSKIDGSVRALEAAENAASRLADSVIQSRRRLSISMMLAQFQLYLRARKSCEPCNPSDRLEAYSRIFAEYKKTTSPALAPRLKQLIDADYDD